MVHAFDSSEAKKLNIQIFETFYHAALERPCELAKKLGTHETYQGSPASEDNLQHNLCGVGPKCILGPGQDQAQHCHAWSSKPILPRPRRDQQLAQGDQVDLQLCHHRPARPSSTELPLCDLTSTT
ncbi:hypothetical protein CF326_g9918 [Tilletia indica]|nr:hypothetical protein CF326_g9918 [Tilletia indica]